MKRIMLVMLAALFLLVSCGKKEEAAAGGEEKKGGKKKFAIMVKSTGNPYNEKEIEGFKKAVEEIGGEVIVKAPEQPTAEAQIQMIEEHISQKEDVIAIA